MNAYTRIFGRGFLIVLLVSMNTYQISHEHIFGAFVVGVGISLTWWSNTRTSAKSELPFAGLCYALGAGAGTVAGLWSSILFYKGL